MKELIQLIEIRDYRAIEERLATHKNIGKTIENEELEIARNRILPGTKQPRSAATLPPSTA